MAKPLIKLISFPLLLLISGWLYAMTFPSVQNLRYENNALTWDAVANAGGYNVYYSASGPSRHGISFDYLTTVRNATSYSTTHSGIYYIVAFNQDATVFSPSASAETLWLRDDGVVDTGEYDGTTVTYYGANNERYLVEQRCTDDLTCAANCNAEGNTGYVTGGFCSASDAHLNASGHQHHYLCYAPFGAAVMTAGAYCAP